MTIVQLSEENPNARDNQQRFRKRPEKSRFSQTFSQFTAVMEEVCWLRNLIHKVGFLSLHTNGGVEWSGVEGEVAKVVELNVVKFVELKESSAVELEPSRLCLLPPHHIVPVVSQRLST